MGLFLQVVPTTTPDPGIIFIHSGFISLGFFLKIANIAFLELSLWVYLNVYVLCFSCIPSNIICITSNW